MGIRQKTTVKSKISNFRFPPSLEPVAQSAPFFSPFSVNPPLFQRTNLLICRACLGEGIFTDRRQLRHGVIDCIIIHFRRKLVNSRGPVAKNKEYNEMSSTNFISFQLPGSA